MNIVHGTGHRAILYIYARHVSWSHLPIYIRTVHVIELSLHKQYSTCHEATYLYTVRVIDLSIYIQYVSSGYLYLLPIYFIRINGGCENSAGCSIQLRPQLQLQIQLQFCQHFNTSRLCVPESIAWSGLECSAETKFYRREGGWVQVATPTVKPEK